MFPIKRFHVGIVILALSSLFTFNLPLFAEGSNNAMLQSNDSISTSVHHSDTTAVNFTLNLPDYTLDAEGSINVAGLSARISTVGAPALPYYTTYIILPPQATAVAHIQELNSKETAVAHIPPVPQRGVESMQVDPQALADIGLTSDENTTLSYTPNAAIYTKNASYPAEKYSLSEPMYARDVRLVELRIYPLRYNPITHTINQATELEVSILFEGANWSDIRPLATNDDTHYRQLADLAINGKQAKNWRSLPPDVTNTPATSLPIGQDTYKIIVNEDGIYEITGQALAAQGMDIGSVDPATIEMLYRGQAVAYQFIDTATPNQLDPTDAIRFYGQAFDGPRSEKLFISDNVYWLWAGGTPLTVPTENNDTGNGYPITTTFTSTVTAEPEIYFVSTYTDKWDYFPNDPDNYYWDYIPQSYPTPVTRSYNLDLPDPASGAINNYTVEILTRESSLAPSFYTYTTTVQVNDYATKGVGSWVSIRDENILGAVPSNELVQKGELNYPQNDIHLTFDHISSGQAQFYLNRITMDYLRNTVAINDELIFSDETGGNKEYQITDFTESNPANILVWDISNPTMPAQINLQVGDISGIGPYTYHLGRQNGSSANFIATTTANIKSVAGLSQYVPTSLDPPGGADWIAISHADFIPAANTLAAHRAAFMSTQVVDVEDVINQYGYGLNTPEAIREFLTYALGNWSTPPSYATLIGDATINPRNLDCPPSPVCDATWDKNEVTYVVTNLSFTDRFQGLVPSDHIFTRLSGDDLLPDIALGRMPAQTLDEAENMVAKTMLYENARPNGSQGDQENLLFVADNLDSGGNFCSENATIGETLPGNLNQTHLCLPSASSTDTDNLRADMSTWLTPNGGSILNYRGHGSISHWAGPHILNTTTYLNFWTNDNKPLVILSADCLDGYFARPNWQALGETLYRDLDNGRGSAAHWSSSGLGYTSEHRALHREFYNGLFALDLFSIGDAVNAAKLAYHQAGLHDSEMYSFTLLGDPAMFVMEHPSCVDSIATAVDPTGSAANDDVILTWLDNAANNGGYNLHGSDTPYFTPDLTPGGTTLQSIIPAGEDSYTDVDAAKLAETSYFYNVQARNCDNSSTENSIEVGVFNFGIQPGLP